jgi:hypothetical protein
VDGDRKEDAFHRRLATDLAFLRARLTHAVEHLEQVPVRALVLVDRHGRGRVPPRLFALTRPMIGPFEAARLEKAGGILEGSEAARA